MGATALESANCAGTGNGRNTLVKMSTDPIIIIVSGLWIIGVVMEPSTVLQATSGPLVILNLLRRVLKIK
jgi:hypothetical protein